MPELVIDECPISYEDFGRGTPIVLTPGGRWGGYVQAKLARELAKDFRVIIWDRPNTGGKSGIKIAGDLSEADLWADTLAGLIEALKLGACYLGEYAGCRTSPLLSVKRPDLVKGLLLAWPSSGKAAAEAVPANMYQPYVRIALREGMEGIVQSNHFAETVSLNPENKGVLLAIDRLHFAKQMSYWAQYFLTSEDLPIAGCRLSEEEWRSIEVPVSVTGGCDPVHSTETAKGLHALLKNSRYNEPVTNPEEWGKLFGKVPFPVTSEYQGDRIAPIWRAFLKELGA